eukprot:SRR837773.5428.p1 GENE.SRR837773.5428~~SRR837773.5428.p1  ORF type:complete len:159 (+),score=30.21 SRR837773.5428:30-479(+)
MDLTTLGLNLNSPDVLYQTFASPWSDAAAAKDPEFYLPLCYYARPQQLKTAHLSKFKPETLFYIFYHLPRDMLQACAAAELCQRGWQFHRDIKAWFLKEEGSDKWVCWDVSAWEKRYYQQAVDPERFLTQNEVRVTSTSSGGSTPAPSV